MSSLRAHLGALATMLVGAPTTLGLVLGLNALSDAPQLDETQREVNFEVEPPPPPPKPSPRPERARPRQQASTARAPLPPAPALGTALSGVELGLPTAGLGDLGAAADSVLGDLNDVVHTEDTVDERPVPRVTTPIEVPAAARARNQGGRLLLNLLVGADGSVREARVLEADPPGVFEAAALRAVRSWTFQPASYQGQSVEVWATLPVEFQP